MLKYLALSALLLLSACFSHKRSTSARPASRVAQPVVKTRKPAQFEYGRTRQEVLATITGRSEMMVAEAVYPQGKLVAYQYARYGKSMDEGTRYYLYFMNDTLIRKSNPEDLRDGIRTAVREYYRKRDRR